MSPKISKTALRLLYGAAGDADRAVSGVFLYLKFYGLNFIRSGSDSSDYSLDELDQLGQYYNAQTYAYDLSPHHERERHGPEEHSAELGDYHLEQECQREHAEHQLVV